MPRMFPRFVISILLVVGCARRPPPPDPVAEKGRHLYARFCATCHGANGNGYVADNAPSLRSPTFLASASDAFLRAGITRGRPGTAMAGYGRGVGGPLEPGDVDAIVAFLRQGGPPPADLGHGAVRGDATHGELVYATYCARCHGTPTQRSTAVHLANPILLETASDLFLRFAVLSGRPPTSMVSWRQTLSPQQIDDVITYVRSMARPAALPVPGGQQALLPPPRPTPASASTSAPRPPSGPVVLNPKGRAPDFVLKEDRFVSIDQVKQALDGKRRVVIADARAPSDWLNLHIAGAISTPYYDATALDQIPNDGTWVLAYCACPHHVSGEVVDELRRRGYKHTAVIDEGIFAWQQKGYPVVAAPGMAPIPAPPRPSPVPVPPPPSH